MQPILDGFQWLGIDWDEGPGIGGPYGPYFQAQRGQLYRDAAMKLLESGHAYPCYMTKEEVDALRKQAESEKRNYVHRGKDRTLAPADAVRLFHEKPTTIRLKVPENRTVVIDDQICGKVEVQTNLIGDPVIARSDGSALYNFATVVDDIGDEDHAHHPREGTPVEHAGAGAGLRSDGRRAAGVRACAGRQRAELEQEAEQARRAQVRDAGRDRDACGPSMRCRPTGPTSRSRRTRASIR